MMPGRPAAPIHRPFDTPRHRPAPPATVQAVRFARRIPPPASGGAQG